MEIILFIAGFVLGGIAVYIPQHLSRKNERKNTDAMLELMKNNSDSMFEQMKLYFENTANKVVQESSANLSEQNKQKQDY